MKGRSGAGKQAQPRPSIVGALKEAMLRSSAVALTAKARNRGRHVADSELLELCHAQPISLSRDFRQQELCVCILPMAFWNLGRATAGLCVLTAGRTEGGSPRGSLQQSQHLSSLFPIGRGPRGVSPPR
ncbi:hypothetical protein NDU88_004407 [Pleurodeles waltl]|uniref:Uncharacterized protein n=1 Tax=Pleurodeles waltl TaxID=8319 RepID=A0AAV7KYB3_PLEWA|nr:hypothetical protein NDU88_004407 [Pleurodeles waltl]